MIIISHQYYRFQFWPTSISWDWVKSLPQKTQLRDRSTRYTCRDVCFGSREVAPVIGVGCRLEIFNDFVGGATCAPIPLISRGPHLHLYGSFHPRQTHLFQTMCRGYDWFLTGRGPLCGFNQLYNLMVNWWFGARCFGNSRGSRRTPK